MDLLHTPTNMRRVNIIQGEWKVLSDPNAVLTTILGSCVAACLPDPLAGIGGMNHFLLPGTGNNNARYANRFGVHLMELLINGLLKQGARRDRIEAKIFSAANTIASFSSVGEQNADFAKQFLKDERIPIVGISTGGDHGRKLEFWQVSGRARQYPLNGVESQKTVALEQRPAPSARPVAVTFSMS